MLATKLKKSTFNYIESELFAYHQTLKEIEELRKDIMFCSENADENTGGGRSSFLSDPTGRISARLVTHKKLSRLEDIAKVIAEVYTSLDKDKQKLIDLKYWTKPQTKTWFGIAQELNVTERTARRWKNAIVQHIADKLGER